MFINESAALLVGKDALRFPHERKPVPNELKMVVIPAPFSKFASLLGSLIPAVMLRSEPKAALISLFDEETQNPSLLSVTARIPAKYAEYGKFT
ncbi:hypothetical protein D3C87_1851970 [compost metagenome]